MTSSYPLPLTAVSRKDRPRRLLIVGAAAVLTLMLAGLAAWHPLSAEAARSSANIYFPVSLSSLDPAEQGDVGTAQVVSQLFETLTAVDAAQQIQPALAASWETQNDGRRWVFHLRPGLMFSDGSAIKASDVVASWMRVLSPSKPGQLAFLLDEVVGARAYREGSGSASGVGIHASGDSDVQVDMTAPASDFPAIVSSATLAVVPPGLDANPSMLKAGTFVGSGGYVLASASDTEITLTGNPHYWAGSPAIGTIHLLTDLGGKSETDEFQAGRLDYTPVVAPWYVNWIKYDRTLGPSLRIDPSPSVDYFGFNTAKAPFNDVHVRRAFALGIDWRRIVSLHPYDLVRATGMVPLGVPGHSTTDYGPKFDLARAKSELAAAGFANGVGFPTVTMITTGLDVAGVWDELLEKGIVTQLRDNLGIDIVYKAVRAGYGTLLQTDAPAIWRMGWVADYPGANDFLGVLLGSGQPYNFGRWSNSEFDTAITQALGATSAAATQQAFDHAQEIILDQAPVIPVFYGSSASLAASGLLGARPNGQGIIRYAGLAWGA